MRRMARRLPSLRPTETYSESNFLRLHTMPTPDAQTSACLVTLEHLACGAMAGDNGWICTTIMDGEQMSRDDALFIAENYASEHDIPVIYESHAD